MSRAQKVSPDVGSAGLYQAAVGESPMECQQFSTCPANAAGQAEAAVSFTNVLGYAENLTLSGQYGTASSNEFSATLAKPRPSGRPVSAELQVLQQFTNFQKWSSFSELLRGGIVSLHRWGDCTLAAPCSAACLLRLPLATSTAQYHVALSSLHHCRVTVAPSHRGGHACKGTSPSAGASALPLQLQPRFDPAASSAP